MPQPDHRRWNCADLQIFVICGLGEQHQMFDSGGTVRDMKLGPGLTFSWKRALGIDRVKRRISRKTGIPLTRAGRRNKLGRFLGMR